MINPTTDGAPRLFDHRLAFLMPRRPGGFTFVEMICVVAIIVILLAILLPAYSRYLDAAYEARCLNNVCIYGKGALASITDHNGRLDPPKDSGGDDVTADLVQPYIPSTPLVCPVYARNHPNNLPFEENNYALNDGLAHYFPNVFTIPVPQNRVVLATEKYSGDASTIWITFDMTMWGTDVAYYTPAELPSHEGEARPPQYHGTAAHRGLNLFMLDGSARLLCPDTGSWQEPSMTYGAPGNSGYYYDWLQFQNREW